MSIVWILLGAICIVLGIAFFLEKSRQPITKADRKDAPGKFAVLSQGVTHYRWHGPSRGPVLIAVHGLTTPSMVWDVVAAGLGGVGYRVLTYDLYGRGLSDAPEGVQDRAFFLRQLNDLLEHEELEDDLTLLGYSMGGSIVSAFTQENTHKVKRLLLLACAGIEMRESGFSRFCRKTPLIGDLVHNLLGGVRLRQGFAAESAASKVPGLHAAQVEQLGRRGFLRSVLASRRGLLDEEQKLAHQHIGRADVPTLAIWAEHDEVIPLAALGTLAQWNRNVRQETIAGAGHALPFTHPDAVLDLLSELLIEPT